MSGYKQTCVGSGERLICYLSSGNADGVSGDQIILAPTYNATGDVFEEIAVKIEATIGNVLADIRK